MSNNRSQSLGYRFALLYRLNSYFIAGKLKSLHISRSQLPFIARLLKAEVPMTQDQLSYHLEIDKAATARALDQLEKKGLIQRQVNPENRRQKMVSATEKAMDIKESFFKILKETHDIFLKGFSPKKIRYLN